MTWFFIMMPLMVLAIAIATVPVIYQSVREHNLINHGSPVKPKPAREVYAVRKVEVDDRQKIAA